MKKLFILAFLIFFSAPLFSQSTDTDPVKKKAALVRMINKTLTETQAILLEESLLKLPLKDLKEIYDKNKDYQEIIQSLEGRSPDDGDERPTNSLSK
ncbi:MAG: hypothetical protein ACJAT2_000377 [Bacteriovoracaceae bacterium]|jgi:hypothetical protein